jgi:cytochrome c-type biogenesis protein CcmH/NrfG
MTETPEQPKLWSNPQAYSLFVICLLLGSITGYLLHSSAPAAASDPGSVQPSTSMTMGQVTSEQVQHMADQKAKPLLAELKSKPNDAALLAAIGDIYFAAHQFPSAQGYYERSLAIVAAQPAVLIRMASCHYYRGDTDGAIALLQRATQIKPGDQLALFNLGMLQWHAKGDPQAAIDAWETLLKTNPNDSERAQVEQLIARARLHLNIPAGTKTTKPAM